MGNIAKTHGSRSLAPRVVRIEIEYEDGRVFRANGDDADTLWQVYTRAVQAESLRGRRYDGPKLKQIA